MRVALVCPYSLEVPGGVQAQVLGLAEALSRAGDEVVVIAPCDVEHPPPGRLSRVVATGGTIPVRANGSVAPVALTVSSLRRLRSAIRDARPEVVHLHEPLAPALCLSLLVAPPRHRETGRALCSGQGATPRSSAPRASTSRASTSRGNVPLVATFHRAGAGLGYRLAGHAARKALLDLGALVAVSEPALETLALAAGRSVARRCEVLFNGVDGDRFAGATPWPVDARGPLCSERPAVVCFLGRHEPRKGLGVLLEAMLGAGAAGAPGNGPFDRTEIWVMGEGPETRSLRARYGESPNLTWCGRVDDLEAARRLKAATVLVAPAIAGESFNLVLLEAFAARVPVVASDLPGQRATAGGAAVLFPPGDAVALRRALAEVLSDASLQEKLRAAGSRRAAAWSIEALAAAYQQRYRSLVG